MPDPWQHRTADADRVRKTIHVPIWRLFLYWIIAVALAGWIGQRQGDSRLVVGVAIMVPVAMALMLAAFRFGRSPLARRHVGTLLWIYICLQAVRLVWDLIAATHHR